MYLRNLHPASDAPIALHDLANWRPDSPLDPFVFDYGPIGARPDGREVGRHLHRFTLSELKAATKTLNERGTTIVQVTDSETNAAYGNRIINLRDGFMETS